MLSLAKPIQDHASPESLSQDGSIHLDDSVGSIKLFFQLLGFSGDVIALPSITDCVVVARQLGDKYEVPYIQMTLYGYLATHTYQEPLKTLAMACEFRDLGLAKKAIAKIPIVQNGAPPSCWLRETVSTVGYSIWYQLMDAALRIGWIDEGGPTSTRWPDVAGEFKL